MSVKVIKKYGDSEEYDFRKIIVAVGMSATRVCIELSASETEKLKELVEPNILFRNSISVGEIHGYVEAALEKVNPVVAKSYKDFRNFKMSTGKALKNDIVNKVDRVTGMRSKENSNSNTDYISTQRTDISKDMSKEIYQEYFLSRDINTAIRLGAIYLHDLSDLLLRQFNCCLTDVGDILRGGYKTDALFYTEPKTISNAIGQLKDIISVISAQHFGE